MHTPPSPFIPKCIHSPPKILRGLRLKKVLKFNDTFPPCAPDKLSNLRFYNALRAPKWLLNFTDYGHADMLDPFFR